MYFYAIFLYDEDNMNDRKHNAYKRITTLRQQCATIVNVPWIFQEC